jgi:ankyrin repeat protein
MDIEFDCICGQHIVTSGGTTAYCPKCHCRHDAAAEPQTLHGAVRKCDKNLAALLIARGANVNANVDGMTPLDLALAYGKNDLAEMLVAKGAVTKTEKDRLGVQLFSAVKIGDKPAVEKLIARGADVNANVDGMTPLDCALGQFNEDIVKLLGARGASKAEWLKAQEAASDRADEQGKAETGTDRYISDDVKDAVWRRDEGRCVKCKSNEKLEFDHIIPVSKGGSNTKRNVQLLCEKCNREKAAKIAY